MKHSVSSFSQLYILSDFLSHHLMQAVDTAPRFSFLHRIGKQDSKLKTHNFNKKKELNTGRHATASNP